MRSLPLIILMLTTRRMPIRLATPSTPSGRPLVRLTSLLVILHASVQPTGGRPANIISHFCFNHNQVCSKTTLCQYLDLAIANTSGMNPAGHASGRLRREDSLHALGVPPRDAEGDTDCNLHLDICFRIPNTHKLSFYPLFIACFADDMDHICINLVLHQFLRATKWASHNTHPQSKGQQCLQVLQLTKSILQLG